MTIDHALYFVDEIVFPDDLDKDEHEKIKQAKRSVGKSLKKYVQKQ